MRPTSVITPMLLLALLAGCTATNPVTFGDTTTTTTASVVDLNDPITQAALGSPPPDGVVWQRSAGALTIVGRTSAADPDEIELLAAALSDLPNRLPAVAEPRFLVRVADIAGAETLTSAVTLTFGPDIYLLDRTFADGDRATSRLDLAYALAHEFAHVAQWFTLDDGYVRRSLAGQIPNVQLSAGSRLVRDYATAVGWVDESSNPDQPAWRLVEGRAPTAYGATSPVEDLADAVALLAVGRANWIDNRRLDWIAEWLDTSTEEFSAGMPWIPAGSEEVLPATPLFDELLAADLAGSPNTGHIEPTSFVLSDPEVAAVTGEIERQLRERGLQGTLGLIDNGSYPRHQGTFVRDDGMVFLVELWDLTQAGDEEGAVLTYVAIW